MINYMFDKRVVEVPSGSAVGLDCGAHRWSCPEQNSSVRLSRSMTG